MAGLVFLVCIPTLAQERRLLSPNKSPQEAGDLIRLHQEETRGPSGSQQIPHGSPSPANAEAQTSMERVLEELLHKLQIDNVTWYTCRNGKYYQVVFPVSAGDQCENCLHFLSELGIGKKLNSIVSVIPCNVFKQGIGDDGNQSDKIENITSDGKGGKAWVKFVDSVRSKLTVAQVVDGVRNSGELTFDYVLLVLTAGMVAAMGLIENSSVNIVAAMLISPLMGPIVTATFGVVIADRKLQLIGIRTELTGLGLCLVFGFIFGLIVGSAENPWGTGDWPTTEMRGRGNYRSLWTGILVALPSGTGVALALLAGSAGPLIGVAISASLLPPVINCGMMWGLACNVLMYPDTINIPYIQGDNLINRTTSYEPLYSDYIPSELAILGCISFCLTLVNIACIFIAAIIVLKIKEVAAPYTSSPDMRRFWEHDIKVTRQYNRSMMISEDSLPIAIRNSGMKSLPRDELLERAVMEAVDDDTFRKVRRVSYYQQAAPEITEQLGIGRRSLVRKGRDGGATGVARDPLRASLLVQHRDSPPAPSPATRLSRSLRLGSRRTNGGGARLSLLPRERPGSALPTIDEGMRGGGAGGADGGRRQPQGAAPSEVANLLQSVSSDRSAIDRKEREAGTKVQ